jgi:hypothetical protein
LFEALDLAIDADDPGRLVLFPEMDAEEDVPEISEACWAILGKSSDEMMCSSSRMVIKRKGAERPVVASCTLLPYSHAFEMGSTLAEARGPVSLNHAFARGFAFSAAHPAVPASEPIVAEEINCDMCIIGAGSAGLSIAAGAAQMGARTVLIEAHRMGGDCLNSGCVPSKSLLAAAKAAKAIRGASRFGVEAGEPRANFEAVNAYVHGVIGSIAPHDSVERFTGLGCTVIERRACFIDDRTIEAAGEIVRARRFVVATGSRAAIPSIAGLDGAPYHQRDDLREQDPPRSPAGDRRGAGRLRDGAGAPPAWRASVDVRHRPDAAQGRSRGGCGRSPRFDDGGRYGPRRD